MIIFGHYSTVYKSFTANDLNISEAGARGIEFQVRQRHAHVFWIPIFPIGKIYAIKRPGDSNKYEMPVDIQMLIQQQQEISTPWYSFSLFFLAALVGLFFITQNKFQDIKYENYSYEKLAENRMFAKYPTTGDYYKFKVDSDSYNNYIILKVIDYTDGHIELAAAHDDVFEKKNYSYSVEDEIKKQKSYIHHTTSIPTDKFQSLFEDLEHSNSVTFAGKKIHFQGLLREKLSE